MILTMSELKELELALRASQYGRYPMWWNGHKCRPVGPMTMTFLHGDEMSADVDISFEVLD